MDERTWERDNDVKGVNRRNCSVPDVSYTDGHMVNATERETFT